MSSKRLKDSTLIAVGNGLKRQLPHHELSHFGGDGMRTVRLAELSTYEGVFVNIGKCFQRDILEVKSRTNFIPCCLLDIYVWKNLFWLRCLKPTLSRCKLRKNYLPSADYVATGQSTLQGRFLDGNGPC